MKKQQVLLMSILTGLLFLFSCNNEAGSGDEAVLTLTTENFRQETSQGVVMVDFWATWCRPCRAMAPVISEIAQETKGKAKVGKVDVDKNGALAQEFNVQGIPNIIILKDGVVVESFVGIQAKETLLSALEKYTSQP